MWLPFSPAFVVLRFHKYKTTAAITINNSQICESKKTTAVTLLMVALIVIIAH